MSGRKTGLGPRLRAAGFDQSTYDRSSGYWRPRCSCCQVLVINGVACHETGCPNQHRASRRGEDE